MRWNLKITLAITVLIATGAVAQPPVEQPRSVRPMVIAARQMNFDDESIAFSDETRYSLSREILTRHYRWEREFQRVWSRRTHLPTASELKIVDPARLEQAIQADNVEETMAVSQHGSPPAYGSCSCTCSK